MKKEKCICLLVCVNPKGRKAPPQKGDKLCPYGKNTAKGKHRHHKPKALHHKGGRGDEKRIDIVLIFNCVHGKSPLKKKAGLSRENFSLTFGGAISKKSNKENDTTYIGKAK